MLHLRNRILGSKCGCIPPISEAKRLVIHLSENSWFPESDKVIYRKLNILPRTPPCVNFGKLNSICSNLDQSLSRSQNTDTQKKLN